MLQLNDQPNHLPVHGDEEGLQRCGHLHNVREVVAVRENEARSTWGRCTRGKVSWHNSCSGAGGSVVASTYMPFYCACKVGGVPHQVADPPSPSPPTHTLHAHKHSVPLPTVHTCPSGVSSWSCSLACRRVSKSRSPPGHAGTPSTATATWFRVSGSTWSCAAAACTGRCRTCMRVHGRACMKGDRSAGALRRSLSLAF